MNNKCYVKIYLNYIKLYLKYVNEILNYTILLRMMLAIS